MGILCMASHKSVSIPRIEAIIHVGIKIREKWYVQQKQNQLHEIFKSE